MPTTEQQILYSSGIAQARMWQPPELPQNIPQINGDIIVRLKFGDIIQELPAGSETDEDRPTKSSTVIWPGGGRVVYPYVKNNRISVKCETMSGEQEQTVLMNNEWPAKIPVGWDRNFNANSFELVDKAKLPMLQVRYDAPNVIEVYGVFVSKNGSVRLAFEDGTTGIASPFVKDLLPKKLKDRKSWFKYPSDVHLGDLAN